MEPLKKNISEYKMYIFTFIALTLLTLLSVWLTQIRFSTPVVVGLILLIAVIQTTIVLLYNMHLKFQEKILLIFVGAVFSLVIAILIITMFDYIFR